MRPSRLLGLAAVLALVGAPATVVHAGAPAPIVVNSAGDGPDLNGGSGACDASILLGRTCTLRAAIPTANADADEDVIKGVFTKPTGRIAFSFTTPVPVPIGRTITVTATQRVTKDTSEFSVARLVTAG